MGPSLAGQCARRRRDELPLVHGHAEACPCGFARFPNAEEIDERIRASADEKRAGLQRLCESLRKSVPDWWNSGWLNARYLARHLGGKIATAEGWSWMAAELPVGRESVIETRDDITLHLKGQIDLVLAQNETAGFEGQKIWIVDYKTGSTKELRSNDLHDSLVKGTTLQLGLYSLAIRALGAAEVSFEHPLARSETCRAAVHGRCSRTHTEHLRRFGSACSKAASSG